MNTTLNDLSNLAPPVLFMLFGMIVLLMEVFTRNKRLIVAVSLLGCVAAGVAALRAVSPAALFAFAGGMVSDDFGNLFNVALAIIAALSIAMSDRYAEDKHIATGEFYSLILLSTSGASLMAMAYDLINVFLGLEVLSIALYILAGFTRREQRSEESSVKYFLLGSFASGFFLYGTALIYGAVGLAVKTTPAAQGISGSFTNFGTIAQVLSPSVAPDLATSPLFVAGIALIIVGLGFKASIVPFHVWTADVYEGAPTSVTAFMSAGAKVGAFAALIRVFQVLAPVTTVGTTALANPVAEATNAPYQAVLWILAALTMVVGNVLAVRQTNIKRMLAYSSIAHAGYILVGVLAWMVTGSGLARDAVLYYLFAYTFMNLGAFAIVIWLGRRGQEFLQIRDYQGLARRHPGAALAMAVFMLSLAGIPPTAGFFGKLYLFLPVIGSNNTSLIALAAIGLVVSVIGVFYYLRIIVGMYFEAPEQDFAGVSPSRGVRATVFIAAVAVVVLGLIPIRGLIPNPNRDTVGGARPAAPSTTPDPVSQQRPRPEPTAAARTAAVRAVSQR